MVIFDSNFALTLIHEIKEGPKDPQTSKPLTYFQERVVGLFNDLQEAGELIGIPAPVLAEIGIKSGRKTVDIIKEFSNSSRFMFLPFDARAAFECIEIARLADANGNKRFDAWPESAYQKIKIDRQIYAIAKVYAATCVYTTDKDLSKICSTHGIRTVSIFDLRIPDKDQQMPLSLPSPAEEDDAEIFENSGTGSDEPESQN